MKRVLPFFLIFALLLALPCAADAEVLGSSSSGVAVYRLQQRLFELDYFNFKATASYGSMTRNAVMKFQEFNGLAADGVAGDSTQEALFSESPKRMPILGNIPFGLTEGSGATGGTADRWSEVDGFFPVGATATVTDLITGKSFSVERVGGKNHATVMPATLTDEEAYLYIFGGTPNWSKRAALVLVDGRRIAASIVGAPRGTEPWSTVGLGGTVDVYFKGSTADFGGLTDAEHEANIKKATVEP